MGGVTALFGREIVALNDLISWVQEGGPIRWAWVLPAAW